MDDLDELTRRLVVTGHPMNDAAKIMAALIIRLGGSVELTQTEFDAAEGLLIDRTPSGLLLEANTDPHYSDLNDDIVI